MHSPVPFPNPQHILSHSLSHYLVIMTLYFSDVVVSVLITCLSPLQYKLQEGKTFVLFITLSSVPEESSLHSRYAYDHQMSVEFCYITRL